MGSVDEDIDSTVEVLGNKKITFVVTGFSKFFAAESNPTEALVTWLQQQHSVISEIPPAAFASFQVLTVAADVVDNWILAAEEKLLTEGCGIQTVVFLHLGVDVSSQKFKLESCARNLAHFRKPDENGLQPQGEAIDPAYPLNHTLTTDLDLPLLREALVRKGFVVDVSLDAGKFVCNWTFYRSLQRTCQYPNWHSLFLHVPSFLTIPEKKQRELVLAVIEGLAQLILKQEA